MEKFFEKNNKADIYLQLNSVHNFYIGFFYKNFYMGLKCIHLWLTHILWLIRS